VKIVADSRNREAWLAARMNYVCGSEVAAMMDVARSDFDRAALVMAKAGLSEPWKGNETSRHGQYLEVDYYPRAARAELGWLLEHHGMLVEDPECSSLASTPDYTMQTPYGLAVVQAKFTTAQAAEDCKPRKDGSPSEAAYAHGLPLYFALQLQAEMACLGASMGALLVLHASGGALKLRPYPCMRHEGAIAQIRKAAPLVLADAAALKAGKIKRTA
jgi:hypothetical protein